MAEKKFKTKTEPVSPFQPLTCFSCLKPPRQQETAYLGEIRLPVSIVDCGDPDCKKSAATEALRLASIPGVEALAV